MATLAGTKINSSNFYQCKKSVFMDDPDDISGLLGPIEVKELMQSFYFWSVCTSNNLDNNIILYRRTPFDKQIQCKQFICVLESNCSNTGRSLQ
jgi:hypothetical protein